MSSELEQAQSLLEAALLALGDAEDGIDGAQRRLENASARGAQRDDREREARAASTPSFEAELLTLLPPAPEPAAADADVPALEAAARDVAPAPEATPPPPVAPVLDGAEAAPRRRGVPNSVRYVVGGAIGLAGAVVLADAILTWTWQEPVSAIKQNSAQKKLTNTLSGVQHDSDARMARIEQMLRSGAGSAAAQRRAQDLLNAQRHATALKLADVKPGQPIAKLWIPKIGLKQTVIQGTQSPQLAKGVGHYTDTNLPGMTGGIGIAGHRTTHGAPFRHIDSLSTGDRIVLRMPYGRYTYKVIGKKVVKPSDVGVLNRGGSHKRLVLTACHPLYSAAKRLVVTAQLSGGPSASRGASQHTNTQEQH